MISAKIIADSLSPTDDRLTTFICVFPRIVLAEFNTHRMLSRNSASSRAIPFKKMVKMVETDPFIPIKWMKEHTGMQGIEYFDGIEANEMSIHWRSAAIMAAKEARRLNDRGLTKQLCNRLLEPFLYHTVIVTASEWQNFFALRAHDAAEIHIQDLAYKMLEEYNKSEPKKLQEGEWHIPFGDTFDKDRLYTMIEADHGVYDPILSYEESKDLLSAGHKRIISEYMVKIATARCARVSYLNFEGKDDYAADIKLHDMLLASGHMSPMEHCAKAMNSEGLNGYSQSDWCGNFRGFIQYRKTIKGENKIDNRIK